MHGKIFKNASNSEIVSNTNVKFTPQKRENVKMSFHEVSMRK